MAYTDHFETVQKLYIAYYQRPADPGGLVSWAKEVEKAGDDGDAFRKVVSAFAFSDEAKALYGTIDNLSIHLVIPKIYTAAFGHEGDAAGRNHYHQKFLSGEYDAGRIVWEILAAADNGTDAAAAKDKTTVANKVKVANTFTEVIAGKKLVDPNFPTAKADFNFTYSGNNAAEEARDFLKKVGADTKIATDYNFDAVERVVLNSKYISQDGDSGNTPQPRTITLTRDATKFIGGNGDDVVYSPLDGVNSTLEAYEVVDGGVQGDNTLRIEMPLTGGNVLPIRTQIKNFQNLEVHSNSLNNNQNLGIDTTITANEVENILIRGSNKEVSINASDSLKTVAYDQGIDTSGSSYIRGKNVEKVSVGNHSGGSLNVTSASDTLDIDVRFATNTNTTANNYGVDGGVKNVNINQKGVLAPINRVQFDESVDSVTIAGRVNSINNLQFSASANNATTQLTKLDISGVDSSTNFTGYTTNALFKNNASLDVKLAGGNDVLTVNNTIGANSKIDLGAGSDFLLYNGPNPNLGIPGGLISQNVTSIDGGTGIDTVDIGLINSQNAAKFVNFENVRVNQSGNPSGNNTHNINGMVFNQLLVNQDFSTSPDINISGLGNTTVFTVDSGGNISNRNITLDTQNTLTMNLNGVSNSTTTLNAKDVSTLNVNTNGAAAQNLLLSDVNDLETINIAGNQGFTLSFDGKTNSISKIDASGLSGSGNFIYSSNGNQLKSNAAVSITGGAGSDYIKLAAGDNLSRVTLTGGTGSDSFDISAISVDGTASNIVTITDFSKNGSAANSDVVVTNLGSAVGKDITGSAATIPTGTTDLHAALSLSNVTNSLAVMNSLQWFIFQGNTYVVANDGSLGLTNNDVVFRIPGSVDLAGRLKMDISSGDITWV